MNEIKKIDKLIGISLNLLLVISVVLDPTDLWFHIKVPAFVLVFFFNITRNKISFIYVPLIFFTIYLITFSFQQCFLSIPVDINASKNILKSFLFLVLLPFVNVKNRTSLFKIFYIVFLLYAFFCVFISIFLHLNYGKAAFLFWKFPYSSTVWSDYNFTIHNRVFLGREFYGIFAKSSPLATLPFVYSLYLFFFYKKRIYIFNSLIFCLFLYFSSTRTNILMAVAIPCMMFIYYLYKEKNYFLFQLCLIFGFAVVMILLVKFVKDPAGGSTSIKALHKASYMNLFSEHPTRYILIGDGPGALFYTEATKSFEAGTELTYYDLIRLYGLLFTFLIFLTFFYPIFILFNSRDNKLAFTFFVGFTGFLLIAGTNPYLIGSTGFFAYTIITYVAKGNLKKEMDLPFLYPYKKQNFFSRLLKYKNY